MLKKDNFNLNEVLVTPLNYNVRPISQNLPEQEQELLQSEANIKLCLTRNGKQFLTVGEELKHIQEKKLYKLRKETFEDYVEKSLGITRFTAHKFIQIYNFVTTSSQTINKYQQYSYSQLQEMVSIQDETLLDKVTPGMTIKRIRELKKEALKPLLEEQRKQAQAEKLEKLDLYLQAKEIAEADKEDLPRSLVLKNKNERLEFLNNFKNWKLIAYIQPIALQIYSYPLKNGAQILAFYVVDSPYGFVQYTLYVRSKTHDYGYRFVLGYLNLSWNSKNELIDWLTQHKNEIE